MSSTVFAQIPLDLLLEIVYNVSCEIVRIEKMIRRTDYG